MSLKSKVGIVLSRHSAELGVKWSQVQLPADTFAGINTHFRHTLSALPVSTIDARTCLADDMTEEVWLNYFELNIVPILLQHNVV